MTTDYLVRQTPREVLLCPCVSQFSSQIFTASFRVAESFLWFLHPPSAFVTTLIISVNLAPSDV